MDVRSSENIKKIMGYVEEIFKVIDEYETSRPGSIGFTKLEEAILWLQVMAQQVPLKQKVEDNKPEPIVVDI